MHLSVDFNDSSVFYVNTTSVDNIHLMIANYPTDSNKVFTMTFIFNKPVFVSNFNGNVPLCEGGISNFNLDQTTVTSVMQKFTFTNLTVITEITPLL